MFVVQCVEYFSAGFFFSFVASMSLKVGWDWHSPPSRFDLNLVAIVVCVLAMRAARRIAALPGATTASGVRADGDVC